MSLDKAIKYGKEKRKLPQGKRGRAYLQCKRHPKLGTLCGVCLGNMMYHTKKSKQKIQEQLDANRGGENEI